MNTGQPYKVMFKEQSQSIRLLFTKFFAAVHFFRKGCTLTYFLVTNLLIVWDSYNFVHNCMHLKLPCTFLGNNDLSIINSYKNHHILFIDIVKQA